MSWVTLIGHWDKSIEVYFVKSALLGGFLHHFTHLNPTGEVQQGSQNFRNLIAVVLIPNKCPLGAFEVTKSDLAKGCQGKAENWRALFQRFCFQATPMTSEMESQGIAEKLGP